jgi:hypothetical protein
VPADAAVRAERIRAAAKGTDAREVARALKSALLGVVLGLLMAALSRGRREAR